MLPAGSEMPPLDLAASRQQAARERIHLDLRNQFDDLAADIRVAAGNPVSLVLETVAQEGCGVVVAGIARDEPFGRYFLGTTVDQLARRSPVPLLVVKQRPIAPYSSLWVATDFSPASRYALEAAVRLFPEARVKLFHAYEVPFEGMLDKAEAHRQFRATAQEACANLIATADIPAETAASIMPVIEHGIPEVLLRNHAGADAGMLLVVGRHGASAVRDLLIGSTARRIMDAVRADTLLVPSPEETSRGG